MTIHYSLVALPGLTSENVKVFVKDESILCIQAEKKVERKVVEGKSEETWQDKRMMTLSDDCFTDLAHISAVMENGLLEIRIEKRLKSSSQLSADRETMVPIVAKSTSSSATAPALSLTEEELETDRFKDTLSS